MAFQWPMFVAAFGGGLFGAAIGGLPAFILTGVVALIGIAIVVAGGSFDFLGLVALGPIFGPHISFAGGAAAAAYAARRGELDDGKDIITPLAGLATPDVLLVGGLFGAGGYALQVPLTNLLLGYTDVIALIVVLSDVLARLLFGRTGLFGTVTDDSHEGGRFTPGGGQVWIAYQQDWLQSAVLGLGSGLFSAWIALRLVEANPGFETAAFLVGWAISAASLAFLAFGLSCPVTHHMTIVAAYAAVVTGSVLVGAVFGVVAALLGEASSRLFLIHGDSHIDPPANAIWIGATIVFVGATLLGVG
ncbi:hypothetical protein BH20ACT9_BH20ACT9_18470 [soil metagenome]